MVFEKVNMGVLILILLFFKSFPANTQNLQWSADGNQFYLVSDDGIFSVNPGDRSKSGLLVTNKELIPKGTNSALAIQSFALSGNESKLLLFTNTQRVWRDNTRGDYWVYDFAANKLFQVGKGLPESSLMFAKFSHDGKKVAYVSKHNIYIENLADGKRTQVTQDGTDRMINGTFDWVYEEEFGCKDGFRWSPDGTRIAYWKLDARAIRNFLMINNTDSIYSYTIPVEYPKVGQDPSSCTVWFYDVATGKNRKANIDSDPVQNYIPRMEWTPDGKSIIFQQLNRQQNDSRIYIAGADGTKAKQIYRETDPAWVDYKSKPVGWDWINDAGDFLWISEKSGWRQIYKVELSGKETLITKDNFDIIEFDLYDKASQSIYFTASPDNATQEYLYTIPLTGGKAKRITPANLPGINKYDISPNGQMASLVSNSASAAAKNIIVSLPQHAAVLKDESGPNPEIRSPKVEFFKIKTADGIEMDGWMVKPTNFAGNKKYPVVFYVYGEPGSQTVLDNSTAGENFLYHGSMANDGYVYISLDNRGTPAPKGREWRKSIYKKIGQLNIRDQAMAAKEILKWSFIDTSRVAVWGWSGGGSSTLNLLFQYPEIYKTGIAIAPVANQLLYDNIYQERYMGVPTTSTADYVKGSPLTYAGNLRGNLLLIHGTADDNVHYQNSEQLVNELIKYNKQFQVMSYPNRSHSIYEGEGTREHLSTLFTNYLKQHCPPGGR